MGKGTKSKESERNQEKEQMSATLEQRATQEVERLKALLFDCGVLPEIVDLLETTIENTAYMKVKLEETREAIKTSKVCIPYDNGGGQTGLRENPLFKGYESLFKSYMSGMRQILDVLPKMAQNVKKEELETPKTMLELVRSKHRKEA